MIEIRHSDETGLDWVKGAYDHDFNYDSVVQLDSLYHWFFKLLDLQPGTRLLDAACGRSQLVNLAIGRKVSAIGVDFAYSPLHDLKENGQGDFISADAELLPFEANSFDYVTSIGSLEHYVSMDKGVRAIANVLKPKGKALIFVPNTFSLFHNVYMAMKTGMPLDDGQPLQRYASRGQWEQLITANGMYIESVHKYEREIPVNWRDFIWYLKHWRRAVYLILSPLLPTNLAMCFAFLCVKEEAG